MTEEHFEETDYDEVDESGARRSWRDRLRGVGSRHEARANVIETRYLSLLRHSLLLIASLLLLGAIILAVWGLLQQIGSSEVEPEPIEISAADIAPDSPAEAQASGEPVARNQPFKISDNLRTRTLRTYREFFAPFERAGESPKDGDIIERIWPEERRDAFNQLDVSTLIGPEGSNLSDGETAALFAVSLTGQASKEPGFQRALEAYRGAKKVRVCRDVTRERKRTVEGWDSYSTDCPGWFYSPIGCPATRTVNEPYTVKSCEMQFPADINAPDAAMAESLDQFLATAAVGSDQALYDAQDREAEINARKVSGRGDLFDAGKLFLAFLGLMLIYLLVVIERHHRVLSQLVPGSRGDDGLHDIG